MGKNTNLITIKDEMTEFLLYTSPDGMVKVEVFLHNENIWLTQDRMAELFGVQRPAITKHLGNIFVWSLISATVGLLLRMTQIFVAGLMNICLIILYLALWLFRLHSTWMIPKPLKP